MVYAVVSKTTGRKALGVRVPPPVQGTILRLASPEVRKKQNFDAGRCSLVPPNH
jgi:hypothetical protein